MKGVSQFHEHGVVHQHITPRHILINRNTMVVKFVDFSHSTLLSKKFQDVTAATMMLPIFQRDGTLEYISPGNSEKKKQGHVERGGKESEMCVCERREEMREK